MARTRRPTGDLDTELEDLPAPARWREWMGRVEAAIFASAEPVLRENLARVVGKACNLELIIDDIRDELRGRPYEIVSRRRRLEFPHETGLWRRRSGRRSAGRKRPNCRASNALILMANRVFSADHPGRAVAVFGQGGFARRDRLAARRRASSPPGRAAQRPARPTPMSRRRRSCRTSVSRALRDLPDIEKLEDAGLSAGRARRCSTATHWRPS